MNNWVSTLSEAVDLIVSNMKVADKRVVHDTPKNELVKFHSVWGQGIRNSMGLWGGNTALLEDTGKSHPDDASMVIIHAVWKKLQSMSDAEIDTSSAAVEDRLELRDLQKVLFEIEDFIQKRVPRGVSCTAKSENGSVTVDADPADNLLTQEIKGFIQKQVPKGANHSVTCNDRSVRSATSLVDDPLTKYEFSSKRTFSDE